MSDLSDLTDLSIAGAAGAIHRRELSPVELTDAYLIRIDKVDPALGCYVEVTQERARADARRAADELAGGQDRGPLHGVPLALKDLVDTAGITTAAGAKVYAERVPAADATVARRLAEAGSVLLGKTNTHELAFGITTTNPHFGPTRNPWDPSRIPGGSSGGSGAAVAAGLAAGAIGTDTGGSIRIPASMCGCVGLKPTFGRVSAAGVVPLSRSADHVGPLTRTVEDAAIVLGAIAGYDPDDAVTVAVAVPDYRAGLSDGIAGLRIGVPRAACFSLVEPEVLAVVEAALEVLAGLGAELVDVELPDAMAAMGQPGEGSLFALVIEESRLAHGVAWAERPADFGPDLAGLYSTPAIDGAGFATALATQRRFTEDMRRVLTSVDLLVAPTTVMTPPPIGAETVTILGFELPVIAAGILNTVAFNFAGLPALSVPCGFTPDGLPVGLQLGGRPFDEATVLRAGHAYEQAAGWSPRPPV
jgi:aspartyl-tRNA(Asn)/glutamyl-tRNA(Gln) amidotransferase subunit A